MNEKKNLTTKETFALAVQNQQKNNLQVAENLYKETLKTDPNHVDAHNNLGIIFKESGELQKAVDCYQKVIQIQPEDAYAYYNLGLVFKELGELQKTINCFQKVIEIQPDRVEDAHVGLGLVFKELGEHQKAISCYEKAIQINPDYGGAHNNLGNALKEIGKHQEALTCFKNAILLNPNDTLTINNLSIILKETQFSNLTQTHNLSLKELLLLLFKRNDIIHDDIFLNARLFLFTEENNNQVRKIVNSDSLLLKNQTIKNLLKEELFLLMLQKSLMADQFIEKMLAKLRYEILFTLVDSNQNILEGHFNFIISLAEQCFLNEYVFAQSKKEINHVNQLTNKIVNNKKINELEMAILGCYIPLHTSKNITNKLLDYKSKNILFNDLITMQIKEPLKETELVNSIKSFSKIFDAVSKKVREQYEEHPYPRWRYAYKNLPSNFLFQLNHEIKPNKIEYSNKFVNPNVLIAGCGTGRHTTMAERYLNANILGVDLSLVSLAYAKRKTEESGFKNIEFLHADILQLKNLNRKFDVIECVGALHHMKDPLTGLKVLLDLLEPHGFLKLGLYSEISRQHIVKAREFIKEKKFKNTIEDIRNFRESIVKEKDDQLLQKIFNINDFYSISMARDLMFHVQEHRFTLPEISKMLKNLNLKFLSFDDPLIKKEFSKIFPNDKKNISLDNWNQFEISNPDTFSNMYQFWVRKIKKI